MAREYYVYIMTGSCGTFYVGVTNNIFRRVAEHKAGLCNFTARYRLTRLIYFESTNDVHAALEREKQIKPWRREKKIRLIKTMNPKFLDLSDQWPTHRTQSGAPEWGDPAGGGTGTDPSAAVGMTGVLG